MKRKIYQYKLKDMLAYALVVLDACESSTLNYGRMTLAQFFKNCDEYDAWDWVVETIHEINNLPKTTYHRIINAIRFGVVNDTRDYNHIPYTEWPDTTREERVSAVKASLTLPTLHKLLNQRLRQQLS